MKKIICLFLVMFSIQSFAQVATEVERKIVLDILAKENISLQSLFDQNKELLIGELTGSGKIIPVEKIEALIHKNGIIFNSNIRDFNPLTSGQILRNIRTIETMEGMSLPVNNFIGAIVSK